MKVLLVEDDEDVARNLATGLTTAGFDVTRVSNGVAAFDSL